MTTEPQQTATTTTTNEGDIWQLQIDKFLDNSYDHTTDPTLQLSNQCVEEARAAVARGEDRVYRLYCDGIFDMFHQGHMLMLYQAKHALGDPSKVHLIAGVCTDELTQRFKGKNVMNTETRVQSLLHCKWVDEVVEAPWVPSQELIDKHQIDFFCHDAIPYASAGSGDVYAFVKQQGKFLATKRTKGISTTDLLVQIVRDYDDHVVRNLKRGVKKDDLNIGMTWPLRAVAHKKEARLKQTLTEVKQQQRLVLDSLKKLTTCVQDRKFNANANSKISQETLCEEEDDEDDTETQKTAGAKLCDELTSVAKHSYDLSCALYNTTCAALSIFNVFSYYDMYKQTNQGMKKD